MNKYLDKVTDLYDKVLRLPSSQFWIIILGLFFFAFVLAGAFGALGLLIGCIISGLAGSLSAVRIFVCDCDQE